MGAWIEIIINLLLNCSTNVAPHVGAWIEMETTPVQLRNMSMSHPTWVRGLKCYKLLFLVILIRVAPHVGAWIEIECR